MRDWIDVARERRDRFSFGSGDSISGIRAVDDRDNQMTDLEAIRIVYDLVVKCLKLPATDEQLDAIFKVREMVKAKNQ